MSFQYKLSRPIKQFKHISFSIIPLGPFFGRFLEQFLSLLNRAPVAPDEPARLVRPELPDLDGVVGQVEVDGELFLAALAQRVLGQVGAAVEP